MKKKRTIIAALFLMLIMLIGGTVSFLTDTKTTTNTFTIGNVSIQLTEPNWNSTNAQNLMPGAVVAKDPTITNLSTTNPAFVFMKVEGPCSTDTTPLEALTYTVNNGWVEIGTGACDATTHKVIRVYAYGTASAMTELAASGSTGALFNNVTLNGNITNPTNQGLSGNLDVVVTAYAIQTSGLGSTTPTAVWANFTN